MRPSRSAARVGLLVLASLTVVIAAVLLIGERRSLFERKNSYYIDLHTASGLKNGNPVELDGVVVGEVGRIVLPEDPAVENIRVWIHVDNSYEDRIRALPNGRALPGPRGDLPYSQARIKTLGLLGDKYIEVSSGAPAYPKVETEGRIPSAQPTNVDALIASGEDVMGNVVEISHSLSAILNRMERGEGLLGELTSSSPASQKLRASLVGTLQKLDRIADKVESGDGPLPRLLNDRQMADRLASSLERFEGLLARAEEGPGLLPGLLNDPAAKASFDETLASLRATSKQLEKFTSGLEGSDALIPKLLKDEAYGRQVSGDLRSLVEELNGLSARLARGEGTAARLINDPQIYDAVNDIVIGVHESRLLRWLIRNRQKAGIKKRYDDAQKEQTAHPGTAQPAPKDEATPEAPEANERPPEAKEPPPAPTETPKPTDPTNPNPAPPPPGGSRQE